MLNNKTRKLQSLTKVSLKKGFRKIQEIVNRFHNKKSRQHKLHNDLEKDRKVVTYKLSTEANEEGTQVQLAFLGALIVIGIIIVTTVYAHYSYIEEHFFNNGTRKE